jgi:hypothetical protein
MELASVTIDPITATALMKVANIIKLGLNSILTKLKWSLKIADYASWVLVFVIALAWKILFLPDGEVIGRSLIVATVWLTIQALGGYGALANIKLLGSTGEKFAKKPLL